LSFNYVYSCRQIYEMAKVGRPSKYDIVDLEQAKILAEKGFTDRDFADLYQVNIDTIYEWKKKHEEFSDTLKEGKAIADNKVERSLFERATGYSCPDTKFATHEGVITDTKEYIKHYPPDTTAAIFWLKNRRPEQWRDKQEIEHSGELNVGAEDARRGLIKKFAKGEE